MGSNDSRITRTRFDMDAEETLNPAKQCPSQVSSAPSAGLQVLVDKMWAGEGMRHAGKDINGMK